MQQSVVEVARHELGDSGSHAILQFEPKDRVALLIQQCEDGSLALPPELVYLAGDLVRRELFRISE